MNLNNLFLSEDYQLAAKKYLSKEIYDFIVGGSGNELSVKHNLMQFQQYQINPKILTGIETVSTEYEYNDIQYDLPLMISPMGIAKICHSNGEQEILSACEQARINYSISCMASTHLSAFSFTRIQPWFQLYPLKDERASLKLVKVAEKMGCSALIITVDAPIIAKRYKDVKNKFALPTGVSQVNLAFNDVEHKEHSVMCDEMFIKALDWSHINKIAKETSLPIYLKGIFDLGSIKKIQALGLKGIIISNHGGRQLDGVLSPITCLANIMKYKGNLHIGLDGGIRCGRDIFISLALGAHFVMVGRPIYWALSVGGKEAIVQYLMQLKQQFKEIMFLSGIQSLAELSDQPNILSHVDF